MTILRSIGAPEAAGHAQTPRLGTKTQLTPTYSKIQQNTVKNAENGRGAFLYGPQKSARRVMGLESTCWILGKYVDWDVVGYVY